MLLAHATDSAIGLAVLVIPAYHCLYSIFVKNWAIQQATKVSSKDFYKATDRKEFERRELEYAKVRDKILSIAVSGRTVNGDEILEHLSAIRGSIFFDEKYRSEYDILWLACLMKSAERDKETLQKKCKSVGIKNIDTVFSYIETVVSGEKLEEEKKESGEKRESGEKKESGGKTVDLIDLLKALGAKMRN